MIKQFPPAHKKFEFLQVDNSFLLILNGAVIKRYPRQKFSKQEAEQSASKEVGRALKKYGAQVIYDGCISI